MSLPLASSQDLYNLFKNTVQQKLPQATDFNDGSIWDGLGGVFSVGGMELQRQTTLAFNKTFIDLANGPEITGNTDDLQTLAVDHYGSLFERPEAIEAVDTITFSRPTNAAGAVDIPDASVVQTKPDANGNVQQYDTDEDVSLTDAGLQTFTIVSGNATLGAVYQDSVTGNLFTVATTIVAQTTLHTTGNNLCGSSGTLTKQSGTGDASITYSACLQPDCVVSVGITALIGGADGNAQAGTINSIETSLTDLTITCTNAGNSSGVDAQDDATYRETIRNLLVSLRAATQAAIQAVALTVAGITVATAIETELPVIQYDIATQAIQVGATFFYIPFVTLYIFTAEGAPNSALIAEVQTAIDSIRAFGVFINVQPADPITINWTGHIVLNPSGPNFLLFSGNPAQIIAAMNNYIATLPSATSFVLGTANAAMMAIYGPAGTNDLVSFATTTPSGDVSIGVGFNAIPGTVELD